MTSSDRHAHPNRADRRGQRPPAPRAQSVAPVVSLNATSTAFGRQSTPNTPSTEHQTTRPTATHEGTPAVNQPDTQSDNQPDARPTAEDLGPADILALFDVARSEAGTIEQLSGCVEQLSLVQEAKRQLAGLSPAQVRSALELRRHSTGLTGLTVSDAG